MGCVCRPELCMKIELAIFECVKRFCCILNQLFPVARSQPNTGQEELEFAAMRIEALKLARQIALSSFRSEVPGLCLPCV